MTTSPLEDVIPNFDSPTLMGFDQKIQEGVRVGGSSNRQFVRFYRKTFIEQHAAKVKEHRTRDGIVVSTQVLEWKDVAVTKEMVEIITPGDKTTYNDVATPWHKREFWNHYVAFRQGNARPVGTELEECDFISAAVLIELNYRRVFTLEQLADASDLLCEQIPQGYELRDIARVRVNGLAAANADSKIQVVTTALEQAQAQIIALQDELAAQKSRFAAMGGTLVNPAGEPISAGAPLDSSGAPIQIERVVEVEEPLSESETVVLGSRPPAPPQGGRGSPLDDISEKSATVAGARPPRPRRERNDQ